MAAVVVIGACGHPPAPPPARESSGSRTEARDATEGARIADAIPPNDRRGPASSVRTDEPHIAPVDGRAVASRSHGGTLRIGIVFSKESEPGTVTKEWSGWFVKQGTVLSNPKLRLVQVTSNAARAEIDASELPSDHVRFFPPGERGSSPAERDGDGRADEPHFQPIEMKVFDARQERGKLVVRIELPQDMRPGSVNRHWTGVFTTDGTAIPGTEFVVAGALAHEIIVEYAGTELPSRTIRLFHPRS